MSEQERAREAAAAMFSPADGTDGEIILHHMDHGVLLSGDAGMPWALEYEIARTIRSEVLRALEEARRKACWPCDREIRALAAKHEQETT